MKNLNKQRVLNFVSLISIAVVNLILSTSVTNAASSAVIIMYHRFGETNYPSTNITLEQFEKHITELSKKKYNVRHVKDIITKIKRGMDLPDRTVGITIDDGYRSIFTQAWPRLKKANLPFTVFIATDPIDRNSSNYMTWDQIRTLKKNGVEIGAHTSSHNHMTNTNNEDNHWELFNSNARMAAEIDYVPNLFAYPFGEASTNNQKQVIEAGYKMAFGQHSGVVNESTNFNYIPRFSINENYGDLERLRLILNTLPLPVKDITPLNPLIKSQNPPDFGFTVILPLKNLNQLSCFSSHEGRVRTERLGQRIEIRMTKPFLKGRTRINCTLPGPNKRWRWLGHLFVAP